MRRGCDRRHTYSSGCLRVAPAGGSRKTSSMTWSDSDYASVLGQSAISPPPGLVVSGGDQTLAVECPFDGSALPPVPLTDTAEVGVAAERARVAQTRWAGTSPARRARVARRFAELVETNQDDLLNLVQLETGKNRASAFEEIADTVGWANYLAAHAARVLAPRRVAGALPVLTRTVERHVPIGVVGVITPWNYPLTLPATDVLPALMAGNAVVLKPDSATPHTGIAVAALLRQAGVPADVLQVVIGAGSVVGSALIESSDYIMFTGSTATGRKVAAECGRRLIGFSAELGGKNPLLVLEDADLKRAVPGAVSACFSNTGQLCVATERLYVHTDRWDDFVPALVEQVANLQVAPGLGWGPDMGSLASEKQLRKIQSQLADAVSRGAKVLAGGRARPDLGPYFFEPTVVTNVPAEAEMFGEETFGPLVALYPVGSDQEAVAKANASPYGLNASVWSRRRGAQAARQIRTGTVNINAGYEAAWASYGGPMGGMGISGVGRRHASQGILKYTQAQTVAQQRFLPLSGPLGMSHRDWARVTRWVLRLSRFRP